MCMFVHSAFVGVCVFHNFTSRGHRELALASGAVRPAQFARSLAAVAQPPSSYTTPTRFLIRWSTCLFLKGDNARRRRRRVLDAGCVARVSSLSGLCLSSFRLWPRRYEKRVCECLPPSLAPLPRLPPPLPEKRVCECLPPSLSGHHLRSLPRQIHVPVKDKGGDGQCGDASHRPHDRTQRRRWFCVRLDFLRRGRSSARRLRCC